MASELLFYFRDKICDQESGHSEETAADHEWHSYSCIRHKRFTLKFPEKNLYAQISVGIVNFIFVEWRKIKIMKF